MAKSLGWTRMPSAQQLLSRILIQMNIFLARPISIVCLLLSANVFVSSQRIVLVLLTFLRFVVAATALASGLLWGPEPGC